MNFKYNSERQQGKHFQLFILHMYMYVNKTFLSIHFVGLFFVAYLVESIKQFSSLDVFSTPNFQMSHVPPRPNKKISLFPVACK